MAVAAEQESSSLFPLSAALTKPNVNSHAWLKWLPAELVEEIIGCLDWDDILRVRRTCWRISILSRSKSVWKHVVYRYLADSPYRQCFDRSIFQHDSKELETFRLARAYKQHCWKNSLFPFRKREVYASPSSVCLLEGGRWLLLGSSGGMVLLYDLEAETLIPRVLIPQQDDLTYDSIATMIADVDKSSNEFRFRLAIFTVRWRGGFVLGMQVWEISPSEPNSPNFLARRLFRFQEQSDCVPHAYAFAGNYLARRLAGREPYIEVLSWGLSSDATKHSSTLTCPTSSGQSWRKGKLFILPGPRILHCTSDELFISGLPPFRDIPLTQLVTQFGNVSTSDLQCSQFTVPFMNNFINAGGISPLFTSSNEQECHLSLLSDAGIWRLVVPSHNIEAAPKMHKVAECPSPNPQATFCMGHEAAIARDYRTLQFLTMSSAEVQTAQHQPQSPPHIALPIGWSDVLPQYDDESGRMVLVGDRGSSILVLDLPLPNYQ